MQTSLLTGSEIIHCIQQLVPPGLPVPQEPRLLEKLKQLTQALIQAYQSSGLLQDDPFNEAWSRSLFLYEAEIRKSLKNKVVLVTGGEGYIGMRLLQKIVELGAKWVVSVDNARCHKTAFTFQAPVQLPKVSFYAVDVRDRDALDAVFKLEKPDIVFHLAAIRIPGEAEKMILETVTSNIFGVDNIIQLCEQHQVQQCIFASTGKASRYWTSEVYAASKKIAEWLFARAAQTGKVLYGMVRFTHLLNNSSMGQQFDQKICLNQAINIHAPERYVIGQNIGEAVHLLLNALCFSELGHLRFILVRNLGWPVESLEVALYKILQSGKNLPIYFQGIPIGYEEAFFLGQVDWSHPTEINTLMNALESLHYNTISNSKDMIVSETVPFSTSVLMEQLSELKSLCSDPLMAPLEIKQKLGYFIREVSLSTFTHASPTRGLQILKWGMNLKQYQQGNFSLISYYPFIELIVKSLGDRLTPEVLAESSISIREMDDLLSALVSFPELQSEISQMQEVLIHYNASNSNDAPQVI